MKRDGDSLQDGERRVESRESAVNPARAIITGDHSAFHARTLMARIRAASWVRPCSARQVSGARLECPVHPADHPLHQRCLRLLRCRSEDHTSELQSLMAHIVCRILLEK